MSIRERILTRPDLAQARAARDIDALAAGLNQQPALALTTRYVTARTILAECAGGAEILAALDAAAAGSTPVKYAVQFLGQNSGLNVGDAATQAMIDALTPAVLTQEQADAVKALAMLPAYVTREQVNDAMFNPDGSEK